MTIKESGDQTINRLTQDLENLQLQVNKIRSEINSLNKTASSSAFTVGSKVAIRNPRRAIERESLGQIWKISKTYPFYHHIIFPDNTKSRRIAKNLRSS